jgi:hypothetical protein
MNDTIEEESFHAKVRRINAEAEERMAEQQELSSQLYKLQLEYQIRIMERELKYGPFYPIAPIIAIGGLFVGGLGVAVGYVHLLSCH